jgi:hypothetical protein
MDARIREQYDDFVKAWRSYERQDALARYDLAARMRFFFEHPSAPTTAQFEHRLGLARSEAVGRAMRVVKCFSREEVEGHAARGYTWADFVQLVAGHAEPVIAALKRTGRLWRVRDRS